MLTLLAFLSLELDNVGGYLFDVHRGFLELMYLGAYQNEIFHDPVSLEPRRNEICDDISHHDGILKNILRKTTNVVHEGTLNNVTTHYPKHGWIGNVISKYHQAKGEVRTLDNLRKIDINRNMFFHKSRFINGYESIDGQLPICRNELLLLNEYSSNSDHWITLNQQVLILESPLKGVNCPAEDTWMMVIHVEGGYFLLESVRYAELGDETYKGVVKLVAFVDERTETVYQVKRALGPYNTPLPYKFFENRNQANLMAPKLKAIREEWSHVLRGMKHVGEYLHRIRVESPATLEKKPDIYRDEEKDSSKSTKSVDESGPSKGKYMGEEMKASHKSNKSDASYTKHHQSKEKNPKVVGSESCSDTSREKASHWCDF